MASCHITNGEFLIFSLYLKHFQTFFSKIIEWMQSFELLAWKKTEVSTYFHQYFKIKVWPHLRSMEIFLLKMYKLRLLCNLFWKSSNHQSPNMETRDFKLSNDIVCQYYLESFLRYYCFKNIHVCNRLGLLHMCNSSCLIHECNYNL